MLKHTILWGLLLLGSTLSPSVYAQLSKGTRYWGGTVEFSGAYGSGERQSLNSKTRSTFQNIGPELQWGVFTNATTLVGLGVGYNLSWYLDNTLATETTNRNLSQSISLLPFLRKYKVLNERWWLFLHGEVGPTYQWDSWRLRGQNTRGESQSDRWQYGLMIKPGVVYHFPKKRWAIEGYANVLSLNALYRPVLPGGQHFSLSTAVGTRVPSLFTLRIARYTSPSSTN